MTPQIPQELIDHLVSIGRSDDFDRLDQIAADFPSERTGHFMRLEPDPWLQIAKGLNEESMKYLIKSLTIIEKQAEFKAGSVSPVIWLFHCLPNPDQQVELIDWVLRHTENPYVPFGRSSHGAKSLAEYQQISARFDERRRARQQAEVDRQSKAKQRKKDEASKNLFAALRRNDEKAIRALLERGADPDFKSEAGQSVRQYAELLGLAYFFESGEAQH